MFYPRKKFFMLQELPGKFICRYVPVFETIFPRCDQLKLYIYNVLLKFYVICKKKKNFKWKTMLKFFWESFFWNLKLIVPLRMARVSLKQQQRRNIYQENVCFMERIWERYALAETCSTTIRKLRILRCTGSKVTIHLPFFRQNWKIHKVVFHDFQIFSHVLQFDAKVAIKRSLF